MYHAKRTRFVSGILAAFGLAITFAQLDSNVAATNTFLPFDLQRLMDLDVQTPAMKVNGKIAFSSDRDGFLDIYVMNADGSNQRQLTFGAVNPADGFAGLTLLIPYGHQTEEKLLSSVIWTTKGSILMS